MSWTRKSKQLRCCRYERIKHISSNNFMITCHAHSKSAQFSTAAQMCRPLRALACIKKAPLPYLLLLSMGLERVPHSQDSSLHFYNQTLLKDFTEAGFAGLLNVLFFVFTYKVTVTK